MEVAGKIVEGGQNIFFAQLADPTTIHFSADATRYFSGEFIFMIFGLPGAALAMYRCAKPEKKKQAGGLLLSAALACMLTGITEPLEFSFLFVAPILFIVQVVLAGAAYMIAHILNIAVGLTFSGGLLDLFLFGILQGNEKTSWLLIIPVGIIYFILYYVIFTVLIKKLDLKTPGREDDDAETKLFTKADYKAKQSGAAGAGAAAAAGDEKSVLITQGLGGKKNISDVDCCATRLRCTVVKPELVNEAVLKATSPSGIIRKGQGIQIIYGPSVAVVKSNLEDYLETAPNEEYIADVPEEAEDVQQEAGETKENSGGEARVMKTLCAPVSGTAAPITEASDEAFAGKMMGDGYIVRPGEGMVYAPEDAEVSFVFPSKHAVGMKSEDGTEYLIHIGVDTVNLRIVKVLNNNGLLVYHNETGGELIFLGNGVGFGRKPAQQVSEIKGAKVYSLVTRRKEQSVLKVVNGIRPEYIEAAGRIIEEAENVFQEVSHEILLPMADHIALAAKRAKENRQIPNPFTPDIRVLFAKEYAVALRGREIIKEMTGYEITDDEAGFITLHIHAGLSDEQVSDTLNTTRIINEGILMIEKAFDQKLPSDSLAYTRLMSHLYYMAARTRRGETTNVDFNDFIFANYPKTGEAAAEVCRFMEQELKKPVAKEEIGFLAIHIQRVISPETV